MSAVEDHEAAALAARERERMLAGSRMGNSFTVQRDDEPGTVLLVPGGALRQWRQVGQNLAAVLDVAALGEDYFATVNRNRPAQDMVAVTVPADRNDHESFEAAKVLARLGL